MVAFALTLAGVALVGLVLRDIWHTLFRPGAHGRASHMISKATWRVVRRTARSRPSRLAVAGPTAMAAVILTWGTVLAVGWALVYWPHLPDAVLLAPGLDPATNTGFLEALYLSLVTLATLGYGDIAPRADWLRVLGPLEAFVGFILLTASISWALSVYPVLSRRRRLAHETALLAEAEASIGGETAAIDAQGAQRLLGELTSQLIVARGDLLQFPVTYYFRDTDERTALPVALGYLVELADDSRAPASPQAVRLQRARLAGAIADLTDLLGSQFLDIEHEGPDAVVRCYLDDHLHRLEARPAPSGGRGE